MNAIDLVLWACAGVLGVVTLWWARPSPVALDWERFFKLSLVTLLRGEVERAQGRGEEWAALGRSKVWYAAPARRPFHKLLAPKVSQLQVPALPGELSLTQDLEAIDGSEERLQRLYAPELDAPLYDEPESAGPEWHLPQYLGQGADWDSVASWGETVSDALERKGQQVWIQFDDLDLPLPELLPRAHRLTPSTPEDTAKAIDALGPDAADRFVLVAGGAQAAILLRTLQAFDGLRDRVLAVVLIDPQLEAEQAWLATHFNHQDFDTELARPTGWFQLRFVPRDAHEALLQTKSLALPAPPAQESGRVAIELVELGLLPGHVQEADALWLSRALVLTVLAWLGSRG